MMAGLCDPSGVGGVSNRDVIVTRWRGRDPLETPKG
jgi:hypothetical protein